jgi:hypothetical protein
MIIIILKIKIKWQKENITFWRVINFYGFLKKDEYIEKLVKFRKVIIKKEYIKTTFY